MGHLPPSACSGFDTNVPRRRSNCEAQALSGAVLVAALSCGGLTLLVSTASAGDQISRGLVYLGTLA